MLLLPFAILTNLWLGAFGPGWGVAAYLLPSAFWLVSSAAITALGTKFTYGEPLTLTSFMGRFARVFPLAAISTGMLAHQVSAFAEGLFGPLHSEFERTPKAASVTRQDAQLNSPAHGRAADVRKIDQVKVHRPYVLSELFFVAYQLTWAVLFAISGITWGALAATLVAGCVIYLAFFYGDHAGNVCFVLDRDELVSLERIRLYVRVLGTVALLLVLFSIGGQFSTHVSVNSRLAGLAPAFYVDVEQNIPTYFTVLLLLIAASLLAVIAMRNRKQVMPQVSEWVVLSLGFLAMAIDEAFQFHERLNIPVGTLLGDGDLGVFYYPWVIPGIALVFVLGLYFLRFLQRLPPTFRFRFLMAAILYLGGAIGVELVGSHHAGLHGSENWTYSMIATLEESLEIAGLIMFTWALLHYFAAQAPDYGLVSPNGRRPAPSPGR
jgi:hypothetical protein